jgi:recombination protein RecA
MIVSAACLREQVQTTLGDRCEAAFLLKKSAADMLPSAVGEIPRGTLTEIAGPASSGRTSLLYSLMAEVSSRQEFCALLDTQDTFDPESAAMAGIRLSQVLWIRCGGNAEHAMKAADLLVQGGGFGLVAIDLGSTPIKVVHRIPLAAWFRLRHAVENTRTLLVVVAQQSHTQSCAALKIELRSSQALWRGILPGCILDGFEATAQCIRNHRAHLRPFSIMR